MADKRRLGRAKGCFAMVLLASAAGCASANHSKTSPPAPPSPDQAAMTKASAAFSLGREAALNGDFPCARDYFDQAVEAVRPARSAAVPSTELSAFSEELYEAILRYEALAAPPEESASTETLVAPELSGIEAPVSSEEISKAKEAVATDTTDASYDIPIVVNEAVLRLVAMFQNDLHDIIARGLARSGRYTPMIERIFQEEGIPKDLVQVAMIESSFLPHARSPKAAQGIWQFMPKTARQYGLTCNASIDERSDPEKATRAAARYLSYLHLLFRDWYLAMAAYNAGEGKVLKGMARTGFTDFWQLAASGQLKAQTQSYVPAVLAMTLISKNPQHYGFEVDFEPPLEYETIVLDRSVSLRSLADAEKVTLETLQELNPELRSEITPRDAAGYILKIPTGTHEDMALAYAAAPTAKLPTYRRYTARSGDTIASVARRYHLRASELAAANSMSEKTKLKRGTVVLIPKKEPVLVAAKSTPKKNGVSSKSSSSKIVAAAPAPKSYTVRGGDTLYRIALKHGTTVAILMSTNSLDSPAQIHPGDTLKIPAKGN
ncbi:MAG TPA: LysM peptidoglycan-binding domain-containing protein [Thermoanaerobaculia bacterium]